MSRRGREKIREEKSSPETDSNRSGSAADRKQRRASRAVKNLSAEQLERKRTNDREAQRIIRQRTKEKISFLEDQVNKLRAHSGPESQIVDTMQHQIRDLVNENQRLSHENEYLRSRLDQAGIVISPAEEAGSYEHMSSMLQPPPPLQRRTSGADTEIESFVDRRGSHEQASSYGYGQTQPWSSESSYPRQSHDGCEPSRTHGAWPSQPSGMGVPAPIGYPTAAATPSYPGSTTSAYNLQSTHLPMHPHIVSSYEPGQTPYFQGHQLKAESQEDDPPQTGEQQQSTQQMFYGNYPPSS